MNPDNDSGCQQNTGGGKNNCGYLVTQSCLVSPLVQKVWVSVLLLSTSEAQALVRSGLEAEELHLSDGALEPVSCAELLLYFFSPAGLDPDSSSFSAYHFPALQILGQHRQRQPRSVCIQDLSCLAVA